MIEDYIHEPIPQDNLVIKQELSCAELLRSATKGCSIFMETYIERHIREHLDPNIDRLTYLDTLLRLYQVKLKTACWYIHEYFDLHRSSWFLPSGNTVSFIPSIPTCLNNADNFLCAHWNVVGLVLRGLILTWNTDRVRYFIQPFLDLLLMDNGFAHMIALWEQWAVMDDNWLHKQLRFGEEFSARTQQLIAILEGK